MDKEQKIFEEYGAGITASDAARGRALEALSARRPRSTMRRWGPATVAVAGVIVAAVVFLPTRTASAADVLRKAEMAISGVKSMKISFYRLRGDGVYHHMIDRTFAGTSSRMDALEGVNKGVVAMRNPSGEYVYSALRGVTLKLRPSESAEGLSGEVTPLEFAKAQSAMGGWSDAKKTVRIDPAAKLDGHPDVYCLVTEDDKKYTSRLFVEKKTGLPLQIDVVRSIGTDGRFSTGRQIFEFNVPLRTDEFVPIKPIVDQAAAFRDQLRKWSKPLAVTGTTKILDLQVTRQGYVFMVYAYLAKAVFRGDEGFYEGFMPSTLSDGTGRRFVKTLDYSIDAGANKNGLPEPRILRTGETLEVAVWLPLEPGSTPPMEKMTVGFETRDWCQVLNAAEAVPARMKAHVKLKARIIDAAEPDFTSSLGFVSQMRDLERSVIQRRGEVYFLEGRFDQARRWFSRARDAWLAVGDQGYPIAGRMITRIADCEEKLGNRDEAARLRVEAERLRLW